MRLPNARLFAQLQQKVSDGFYGDAADILQDDNPSLDVFGQPTSVSTTTTSISCSFTDAIKLGPTALEKWKGFADISEIEAEIRWEGSPTPAKGNRVTLTGRFDGADYTDNTFEIVGIRDRDVFGFVCVLKKVAI